MKRLIVIGNGMAGARVVEEIVARGGAERFAITVFGAEPRGGYNRVLLSDVLGGSRDAREIFLNPVDWYAENRVTLRAGVPAVAVDRRARTVNAADGATYPYDELIIATGSRSAFPAMPGLRDPAGALRPGVFGFRSLADCEAMLAWARDARRVVVVGGGLLGLEAARGLLEHGLDVLVVHRASRLMNLQLDAEAAAMLRQNVEELGIRVRLEASASALLGRAGVDGLVLADGTRLACDMVVFATGIQPSTELAARAGLTVERGIVVDDALRATGSRTIYAIGECAQHRGLVHGLLAPAWEQAAVVADRLTGADPDASYRGSKPATKLKVSGVELASMGIVEPEHERDEVVRYSEPARGIYKSVIVRDGKLIGAILLGDLSRTPFLTQALDHGTALPQERASLLFDLRGRLGEVGVDEMLPEAYVCDCNGVSKADIQACAAAGKTTIREIAAATRAGTGCGSCTDRVLQVVKSAASENHPMRAAA
jgi:nitrite reductase (NADH) large subunit